MIAPGGDPAFLCPPAPELVMTLLVPIDLSAPSRGAIQLATLVGHEQEAGLVLFHVAEETPPLSLLAQLHALAEPAHRLEVDARLRTAQGSPPACIVEEALRRKSRWIVMGTRGVHTPDGPQTGSVARAVIRRSPVPVMAIRPPRFPSHPPRSGPLLGPQVCLVTDPTASAADTRAARELAPLLAKALGGEWRRLPAAHLPPSNTASPTGGLPARGDSHAGAPAPQTTLLVPLVLDAPDPPWLDPLLRQSAEPVILVSAGASGAPAASG